MAITQISLFMMNQPGQLVEAVGILSEGGANIRAMSIAESNDFGILRAIVSDTDLAVRLLKEKYLISKTEVIAARMGDKSGSLFPILKALNEANINIEYMYAFTGTGVDEAYVVLRVNDVQTAEAVLKASGIPTLSDDSLKL